MSELQNKWNSLKRDLQSEKFPETEISQEKLQKIIEVADREFITDINMLIDKINSDIVYASLFCSFMRKNGKLKKVFNSPILRDQKVIMHMELDDQREKESDGSLILSGTESYIDICSYRDAYESEEAFLGEAFNDHLMEIVMINDIAFTGDWIENCKFSITEYINDSVRFNSIGELTQTERV